MIPTRLGAQLCKPLRRSYTFSQIAKASNTVGFIGLGIMGAQMVQNLAKSGHNILIYDISEVSIKEVLKSGAKNVQAAKSVSDVGAASSTIVTMLPSSPQVKDVYASSKGLFSVVKPDTLMIDTTTGDPLTCQEMAALALKKQCHYIDAPVSGGVMAARAATLTFMVGATEQQFQRARSFLDKMGKNIIHCGPVGMGEAAKICNNMLLGISMIGTSEAMNLGIRMGLDPKLLASVINTSSGRCWSSEIYNPVPGVLPNVPASNDYAGGFGTALITKDLGLAENVAKATKTPIPLGSAAHEMYKTLCSQGQGTKDFSVVYKYLLELSKSK